MTTAHPSVPTTGDSCTSDVTAEGAAVCAVVTEESVPQTQKQSAKQAANMRTCLVTGDELAKDAMIRFVIAPDMSVVPDLAQNLPGRGLWVTATHAAITTATKKNLFARAAKSPAKPAADLADQTAALMRKRCLSFLGLARSAGIATLGQMQVEMAAKAGRITYLFIADTAGRDVDKLGSAVANLTITRRFTRFELGAALGHDQLVYAGLAPHQLTTRIRDAVIMLTQLMAPPETLSLQSPSATETDA